RTGLPLRATTPMSPRARAPLPSPPTRRSPDLADAAPGRRAGQSAEGGCRPGAPEREPHARAGRDGRVAVLNLRGVKIGGRAVAEIGRAHVRTPVAAKSRSRASACSEKKIRTSA